MAFMGLLVRIGAVALLLGACVAKPAVVPPAPAPTAAAPAPASRFRLAACTEAPVRLQGPPDAQQSRGCVATFVQRVSDPATVRRLGVSAVERRYLVYAPAALPPRPAPVVFVFPGYSASAEAAAFYYTHTRWEALADRDGFVVVYGNGLPNPPNAREKPAMPKGGFLQGCLADHAGEGIDVAYVRGILERLATEVAVNRTRIYATGLSAGGGMAFELALEARIWSRPSLPSRRCRSSPRAPGFTLAIRARATSACRSRCSRRRTIRSFPTRPAALASTRTRATPAWNRRATRG